MDIQTALRTAIRSLRLRRIPKASLDAEILLSKTLRRSREDILAHPEDQLTKREQQQYRDWIRQRSRHVPLAYIVRRQYFYGHEFTVDDRVMTPRPSTEQLFEESLRRIRELKPSPRSVVDVGTGSGCLAILLAKYLPEIQVFATDLSSKALTVAKRNATMHQVDDRITFLKGSLLKPLKTKTVQCIISNPPYLPANIVGSLSAAGIIDADAVKATGYEPREALTDESRDGQGLTEQLLDEARRSLDVAGLIGLEVYPPAARRVMEYALTIFPTANAEIVKDLSGQDHFVFLRA